MKKLVTIAVIADLAHLVEEALTGMHDDPLIASAWARLAPLGARHAAYLVFQITFALGIVACALVALGARRVVLFAFGLVLLGESHHILRAIYTHSWSSGLATSFALPLLGALLMKEIACSTTSSSPWESVASSSGSHRSSPRARRRGSSDFRPVTTIPPRA
ncbi:MAG TPA: hypothetical protein VGH28_16790 [Polyangiaceae bacterium]|jgi:hypothetical protein